MNTYWLDSGYLPPPDDDPTEVAAAAAAALAARTAGGGSSTGARLAGLHHSLLSSLPPRMRSWLHLSHLPPPSPQPPPPPPVEGTTVARERYSAGGSNKSRFANFSATNVVGPNSGNSNFDQLSMGSTAHALDSAAMVVSASLALQQQQQQTEQQQRDAAAGSAAVKDLCVSALVDVETGGTALSGYPVTGTVSRCPTTASGHGRILEPPPRVHLVLDAGGAEAVTGAAAGPGAGQGPCMVAESSSPASALPSITATTTQEDSGNDWPSGRTPGTPTAAALE